MASRKSSMIKQRTEMGSNSRVEAQTGVSKIDKGIDYRTGDQCDPGVENFGEDLVFRREVVINASRFDAHRFGDRPHRRLGVPIVKESLGGDLKKALAGVGQGDSDVETLPLGPNKR
jgi:hypothetical protein